MTTLSPPLEPVEFRELPEWIGKTPNERPPPRVQLRVFQKYGGKCHRSGIKIRPGDKWECDHIQAIINGGANRESNLAPILLDKHKDKTAADVAIKAKTAAMAKKNLGIREARGRSLTHPKLKRRMDGTVVERFQRPGDDFGSDEPPEML